MRWSRAGPLQARVRRLLAARSTVATVWLHGSTTVRETESPYVGTFDIGLGTPLPKRICELPYLRDRTKRHFPASGCVTFEPSNVLRLSGRRPPRLGRDALVARRSAPSAG